MNSGIFKSKDEAHQKFITSKSFCFYKKLNIALFFALLFLPIKFATTPSQSYAGSHYFIIVLKVRDNLKEETPHLYYLLSN